MARSRNKKDKLSALVEELNIQYNIAPSSNRPLPKAFNDICKIGNIKLSEYHAEIRPEAEYEPWRKGVKQRAKWLTKEVRRCYKDSANELDWRLATESDVFFRFKIEMKW